MRHGSSAALGDAADLRILGAGGTVRAPGRSLRPRSGKLAALSDAAAFRIPGDGPTVRAPGRSPRLRSGKLGRPGQHCSLPDPRRRQHSQSTGKIFWIQEQAARPPWATPQLSGSSVPAARSEHREDLRYPGAGSSRALDALQPSGSSASAARSEHPADLRSPGAGSSPALGALQLSGSSARRPHGKSTRQIPEARERAARRPWMCCRPSRILGAGRTVRAPGGSPKPGSGQLAGPGCAAGPSGSSVPAARSEHQADLRIPGAGSSPILYTLQVLEKTDSNER